MPANSHMVWPPNPKHGIFCAQVKNLKRIKVRRASQTREELRLQYMKCFILQDGVKVPRRNCVRWWPTVEISIQGDFQLHMITLNIGPCSLLQQDWCPAAFCPFLLHNEPQLFVSSNLSLRPTYSHWLWIINLFHANVGFRNLLLRCLKGCHHFRENSIKWKASQLTWD